MTRKLDIYQKKHTKILLIIAILLGGVCIHTFMGYSSADLSGHAWGSDDAYITYRYAQNFADGNGIVFNAGERVEGYSNFLYVLIMSLVCKFIKVKEYIYFFSVGINGVLTVIAYLIFVDFLKKSLDSKRVLIGGMLFVCNPLIWLNCASGLETMLILLIQIGSWVNLQYYLDVKDKSKLFNLCIFLAFSIISRIDGFILPILVLSYLLIKRDRVGAIFTAITLGIVQGLYSIWRYIYYGDIIGNTYYAKVSGTVIQRLYSGLNDLVQIVFSTGYWVYFTLLIITFIIILKRRERSFLDKFQVIPFEYYFTAAWLCYWIYIGGDVFKERFLLILFPMGIRVLLTLLKKENYTGIIIGVITVCLLLQMVPLLSDSRFSYNYPKYDRWITLGEYIGKRYPNKVIAIDAAGKVPFFSGLQTIDMLGLNDKYIGKIDVTGKNFVVGHNKYDSEYILSKKPDLIAAWISPNLDLAWDLSREKYGSNYYVKYLLNSLQQSKNTDVVDVSDYRLHEIVHLINEGYRYGVLCKGSIKRYPINKIIFGNPDYSIYLKEGFSEPEKNGTAKWRWSNGRQSKFEIPLKENTEYNMVLNIMPFTIPNAKQDIQIYLNGQYIYKLSIDSNDYKDYFVKLHKDKVRELNQIVLKYNYARSPKEVNGANDARLLGVNFNCITFQEM